MWRRELGRWRDPGQLLVSGRDSLLPIGASPGHRSRGRRRRTRDLRGASSLWCPLLGREGRRTRDPRACSSAVSASPATSRKICKGVQVRSLLTIWSCEDGGWECRGGPEGRDYGDDAWQGLRRQGCCCCRSIPGWTTP